MKRFAVMMLAALGAFFMAGCGDTIDGTDQKSFQSSSAQIALGLDDEQLIEFVAAANLIDEREKEPRKALDGMTVGDVIDKAREIDEKAFEDKLEEFNKMPEAVRTQIIKEIRSQAEVAAGSRE